MWKKCKKKLSNGHSPQIHENGELLVRMCRGESHFSRKWPLASVRESGESAQHGLANVGESGESVQHGLANDGESGESAQHGSANVGESGESRIFLKKAILANASTCWKWIISVEYSHSLNLRASGHCLADLIKRMITITKIDSYIEYALEQGSQTQMALGAA